MRYDYVRPDLFLLRTLARHVIMWDDIEATDEWFLQSLPNIYRRRYRLTGVRRLKSDDMPFFNIIAGLCFTLGLRYAGSGQIDVRDILISYLDQFIRICRLPAVNYDGKLARNSVRNCQDVVALSAASVMAGTGDLNVFRRLRSLHGRVDAETPYGSHMAAHMAIGMLFLGGGNCTLGTSDIATASLLCAFYPIFPMTVLDNKCHLQAFRHLWVLAVEPRCLVPRDIDTRRPISAPVTVTTKYGIGKETRGPCLLPELDSIAKVEVLSPDHWPLILDFGDNDTLLEKFRQGDQSVYLRRKATYSLSASSVFVSTLSGLSEAQDILPISTSASNQTKGLPLTLPSLDALVSSGKNTLCMSPSRNLWDWIFNLPSLQSLDLRERSLVMSPVQSRIRASGQSYISYAPWLRTSSIDTKLVLENCVQNISRIASGKRVEPDEIRDRIWQLRLLFNWIEEGRLEDRAESEEDDGDHVIDKEKSLVSDDKNGLWLRKDFIEEAKWKVWGVQMGDYNRVSE